MDHRSLAREARAQHSSRISERRRESPSDAAADTARIKKAFKEHDAQLHGGKSTRLHLKDGGCADGSANAARLDRPGRARGGMSPMMGKKGKSGKGNHVNVIVASGGGQDRPVPVPVPSAGRTPPPPPPMPPPGMGGPGGPPPGMPPGGPPVGVGPAVGGPPGALPPRPIPGLRARGGAATDAATAHGKNLAFQMKAGAASGVGRMAKAKMPIPDEDAAGD